MGGPQLTVCVQFGHVVDSWYTPSGRHLIECSVLVGSISLFSMKCPALYVK